MNKLFDKYCEPCLQLGIRKKVRTLCDECRELLCQECSDAHLRFKLSKNHSLIDLDLPGEEARSANEDELVSDFLDHAIASDTTVLYRAQVALEGGSRIVKQGSTNEKTKADERTKKPDVDNSKLKPDKISRFSVKRPDDKINVHLTAILALGDKVIIVDTNNKKLKLFDHSGHYLSATDLKDVTCGITRIHEDGLATCGFGNKVFLWKLHGDIIIAEDVAYDVDHAADGIHYNSTFYGVLHRNDNAVTILDKQGMRVRNITMKEAFGKKIDFGCDIHMDRDTHNIYIPCWYDNNGVLCMSVEGEAMWFTPLADVELFGITEIHSVLYVANSKKHKGCLILISKTGQYIGKLLENGELDGEPENIDFDEKKQNLCVSHCFTRAKRHIISVFSLA